MTRERKLSALQTWHYTPRMRLNAPRTSLRILIVSVAVAAHAGTAIAQPQGRGALPPVRIGPSAPVPPEVAMLRPGPTERQQINDALHAFIAGDRSPASDVLKK